ncbi:MAG: glutamate-5-semialdehyde dehydrogenase [Clostridia bacterium]|nr:glutamate-5-semialdehyde dehydrogenase [Clostridia bacterium]
MDVYSLCEKTKQASNEFFDIQTDKKNKILIDLKELIQNNIEEIQNINKIDIENAKNNNYFESFIDRLTMTNSRIQTMINGIDDVIDLPDYVGKIEDNYTLKNGLIVNKVRAPLGVIGIIFESRPNVTIDASILCIKSGNGVVLKGGKEAINTNRFLVSLIKQALLKNNINENLVSFIDSIDREDTLSLLKQDKFIDVIIPRGGEKLKSFVNKESSIPVISSSGGNCHIYLSKYADLELAKTVIVNAKTSRPSVCNAVETILIDKDILNDCKDILLSLNSFGVEIRGTEEVKSIFINTRIIDEKEYYTEYEDLIIKVIPVKSIDEAISFINKYGTHHSDAIITTNEDEKNKFSKLVDSACVYINASTRFTDGFELGLGAEMGISTQKLHVRGPIGLKELTSLKYVINGNGQIRG